MVTPTDWYAYLQEKVFGPVSFSTLQHWAAIGSITAEAQIGNEPDGPWQAASYYPDLELHWQITDPEGNIFFPCHILALRQEVASGRIGPDWRVTHLPSGEQHAVVDALCSALIEQNRILEDQLSVAAEELRRQVSSQMFPPELVDGTADESSILANWRIMVKDRDMQEREAQKWQRFYEDELARNAAREQEFQTQIDQLQLTQQRNAERIKGLERRRAQLENLLQMQQPSSEDGTDQDLVAAYYELRANFERMAESLELRGRQLEEARSEIRSTEGRARRRIAEVEQSLDRERNSARETSVQLSQMEQTHADLMRAYRDLNDRLIRLKNQMQAPTPQLTGMGPRSATRTPQREAMPTPTQEREPESPPASAARKKIRLD